MRQLLRAAVFPAIGVVSWILYVLACGPPLFSDDGSKVLLAAVDPSTDAETVMVCDRHSGDCRSLLTVAKGGLLRAAWGPGGHGVVVTRGNGEIVVLPDTGEGPHIFRFGDPGQEDEYVAFAPPVVGSNVFLWDDARIVRLDVYTGETKTAEIDKYENQADDAGLYLIQAQDEVMYLRQIRSVSETDPTNEPDRLEFGKLDPTALTLTPMFTTETFDDSRPFAAARGGTAIAWPVKVEEAWSLLVFENGALHRDIPLDERTEPGVPRWSPDGSRIYLPFTTEIGDKRCEVRVLEIAVDSGMQRQIPLYSIKSTTDSEPWPEIDISKDGTVLVGAPSKVEDASENSPTGGELAIYLVDLTDSRRPVTRVPVRLPAATGAPGR